MNHELRPVQKAAYEDAKPRIPTQQLRMLRAYWLAYPQGLTDYGAAVIAEMTDDAYWVRASELRLKRCFTSIMYDDKGQIVKGLGNKKSMRTMCKINATGMSYLWSVEEP